MTHVYCPSCGVRFTRATAVHLEVCPDCGGSPQSAPSAEHVLGYRLSAGSPDARPQDVAVAVALPRPTEGSS